MAFSSPYLAGNFAPVTDETTITGLAVDGALPAGLDGQYLRLGPNPTRRPDEPYEWSDTDTMVHAVELRDGRAVSYRNRWILTPHVAGVLGLGPPTSRIDTCERVIHLNRRLLAVARSGTAYDVDRSLRTRQVGVDDDVASALRRDRCLAETASGHAHHPLVVDAESDGLLRPVGGLTIELGRRTVEILDPTPQGWLTAAPTQGRPLRFVYSLALDDDRPFAGTVAYKHDLALGTRSSFDFGPGRHPGELTFVPDDDRRHHEDGGWLVGFVHHDQRGADDLVVLDARAPHDGPVATVQLPRRVPFGWHGAWRAR